MSQINIMALRHSAFYSPLLMTVAAGFLRDEGLQPSYSLATTDNPLPDAIVSGTCHVAQSAVATGFSFLEQGIESPVVHFARINARDGFFIAARENDTDFSWDKLRHKPVLVDHFFQPMAMLKYALHKQNIDSAELDIIDAGDVEAIDAAFRAGKGDYVHQQGPAPQQLEHDGFGYVVASVGDAVGPVAFSSLCARRDWLQTDMASVFMRAYRKALQYTIDAPAEEIAAYEMEADFFPGINQEVLVNTINLYKKLGCWQAEPEIGRDEYETLLDVFEFSGLITKRHEYESLIVPPP